MNTRTSLNDKNEADDIEVALARDCSLAVRISKQSGRYLLELVEGETAEVLDARPYPSIATARAESHRIITDADNRAKIIRYLQTALDEDPSMETMWDEDAYLATFPLSRAPYRLLTVRILPLSLGPSAESVAVTLCISSIDGLDDPTDAEAAAFDALRDAAVDNRSGWSIFENAPEAVEAIRSLTRALSASTRS